MDKHHKVKDRRGFLEQVLSFGASIFHSEKINTEKEEDQMVKVLTADGKLVSIHKNALNHSEKQRNISKTELMDWGTGKNQAKHE